ncbi:hypothetical protein ACP275_08G227100 [Erythranthe tilingii]
MEQVKAAANKRKIQNSSGDEGTEPYDDIDTDAIAEVFGKERNACVRAVGSCISKKQLTHLGIAKSKIQQNEKALKDASDEKDGIIFRIDGLEGLLRSLHSKIDKTSYTSASSSELGSNSTSPPIYSTQRLNIPTVSHAPAANANAPNPRVYLCDKFGRKIARGYVVTNDTSGVCHFKIVGPEEKKVYIEEVLDPNARVWYPPQGVMIRWQASSKGDL